VSPKSSASQEIPHILWNLKVHYHVHKRPPQAPVLKLSPPIQFLLRPPFTTTLHICLGLGSCHFLWVFLPKPCMYFFHSLFLLLLFACPTHLILLDLLILTKFDKAYKLWSSSLCNFVKLLFPPPQVQISSSAPCSPTPSLYILPSLWWTKFNTHNNGPSYS